MAKQVPWNKFIIEEFITLAALNHTEEMIIRTRAAGWTITRQSIELNMSPASISRTIKRLKKRYDDVQKYSVILPPRKYSAEETYMDTH